MITNIALRHKATESNNTQSMANTPEALEPTILAWSCLLSFNASDRLPSAQLEHNRRRVTLTDEAGRDGQNDWRVIIHSCRGRRRLDTGE